jgi:hypothetical protein
VSEAKNKKLVRPDPKAHFGKRRLRRKHPRCPKTTTNASNDIWTADYKGHFKTKKEKILTAARQRGYRFKQKLTLPNGRSRIQLDAKIAERFMT